MEHKAKGGHDLSLVTLHLTDNHVWMVPEQNFLFVSMFHPAGIPEKEGLAFLRIFLI
jgi:hypothetical protein